MAKDQTLRVILGDQLSRNIAALADVEPSDVILLAEVIDEATYVPHHPKKIAFIFSAMRHFAAALAAQGHNIDYIHLDDPANTGTLTGEVSRAAKRHQVARIIVTHPGEWRVLQDISAWEKMAKVPVEIRADDRFFCSSERFQGFAKNRKQLRMEFFYREMRVEHKILLDTDGKPEGGAWNFDAENRKKLPKNIAIPEIYHVAPDEITRDVLALVAARFGDHFGSLDDFGFAVTEGQALQAFNLFIKERLARFGDYQDAMKTGADYLFHAVISPYLNVGLLDPRRICDMVEDAYRSGQVPLNSAEGFIRQILGWREYMRGIYWLKMPHYTATNYFKAHRKLPAFYWGGETKMNCIATCVDQTRRLSYAHHIQRLMVTGNFALLAGIDPVAVNEWYLAVYADAYEWVELPNTHGMALFADGGTLSSKPYAASGKYINRMSDYCRHCAYDVQQNTGKEACPFNYLYWNFLIINADKLRHNPRMTLIYKNLDRLEKIQHAAIVESATNFFDTLESA